MGPFYLVRGHLCVQITGSILVGRRAHEALLAYRTSVRPHYTNNPNEKHFFVQREGKPLNVGTMRKIMARVGQDAKMPRLHAHLLRHASATNYLVHGGDVLSLQRKLGHSSLTMTDRYVHLASDQAAIIQERVAPIDKLDVKPMRVPKERQLVSTIASLSAAPRCGNAMSCERLRRHLVAA